MRQRFFSATNFLLGRFGYRLRKSKSRRQAALKPRALRCETLETRTLLTGTLAGGKWNDLNANGVWDNGEPGLEGWTIYVDENQNGQFDAGELSAVSGADGSCSIGNVPAGSQLVGEVPQPGWKPVTGGGLKWRDDWTDGVDGWSGRRGWPGRSTGSRSERRR